ncbi:MAG TPA: isocitrate lyase/phosphoenolpyruvate mutase family protein [Polyangiales bacterium]|jgi:2-methylisocitrate lyase-like PEP mutase family enzyme
MSKQDTARRAFRRLHEHGCFVIPNPWDVGTARYLRHLGFGALATTSSGFAFSRGVPDTDGALPLTAALEHIREIVDATELPVNADFESGYARAPEALARNVFACVATGVAGLSIDDATGEKRVPLFEIGLAVERIRAAKAAIVESGAEVLLTARAECHLVGLSRPLEESIRRLQAYSEAGADVLYAPGLRDRHAIATLVQSLAPRPVNVLVSANLGMRVIDLAELGVRRISLGSALARTAWTSFMSAARALADGGEFDAFDGIVSFPELNEFFRRDHAGRTAREF